jgi:hypothetical protein
MGFETEAQRVQFQRTLQWMQELFGDAVVPREDAFAIAMAAGSTLVSIAILPWGEDDAMISLRMYLGQAAPQPELLQDLLQRNGNLVFGSFGIGPEHQIFLQHVLLGSACPREALFTVMLYMVEVAEEYGELLPETEDETPVPGSAEDVQDRTRRETILDTLRELWQDETAFVLFADADQPDNYVQFADFGGEVPLIMEVTSRDYEDEGQDLPRLTPEQIEALVALGFSREANPNHRARFATGDPEYFADLAEQAFAILGSSPEETVTVEVGHWLPEDDDDADQDRPRIIPIYVERETPEFDVEAGEQMLAEIKALQARYRGEDGEVRTVEPPYIVTYMERDGTYEGFDEEADIMLISLSQAMQAGAMTPEQVREAFRPYREFYPEIYEPYFEEEEEWSFPAATDDLEPLESNRFRHEADAAGIEGVAIAREGLSPMSGDILEVQGKESLDRLRNHFRGRYQIVESADGSYWHELDPVTLQAKIEEARRTGATRI